MATSKSGRWCSWFCASSTALGVAVGAATAGVTAVAAYADDDWLVIDVEVWWLLSAVMYLHCSRFQEHLNLTGAYCSSARLWRYILRASDGSILMYSTLSVLFVDPFFCLCHPVSKPSAAPGSNLASHSGLQVALC